MNAPAFFSLEALGGLGAIFAFGFAILAIALQIILVVAVYHDAARLEEDGRRTKFLSKVWWSIAVLLFSLPGLAIYWAMHHSTLRQD